MFNQVKDKFEKAASQGTGYDPGDGTWKTPSIRNYEKFKEDFSPKEAQGGAFTKEMGQEQYRQQEEARKQQEIRDKQLGIAKEFEDPNGIPSEAFRRFRSERMKDLSADQRSQKRSLSRRGLGYGGIAEGADARLQTEAGYDLETGKSKIKSAADEQAQQIRNDVLNNAIKEQQTKQVLFDSVYNNALNDYRQRRQSMKSFGQAVGGIAGTIYGGGVGGTVGATAGGELMS
jgi:hypothetical protein